MIQRIVQAQGYSRITVRQELGNEALAGQRSAEPRLLRKVAT